MTGLSVADVRPSSPRRPIRRAFTVVELLIAIGIVGILLALIVPAVGWSRNAARRAACQNKLRQIGVAVQNFEAANRRYPNAFCGVVNFRHQQYTYWCVSPIGQLTPHLDAMVEWKLIHASNRPPNWDPSLVPLNAPASLHCPADPLASGRATSFRFNRGLLPTYPGDPHGVFTGFISRRASEVTDGLSRTVFISERLISTSEGTDRERDPILAEGESTAFAEGCQAVNRSPLPPVPAKPAPPWGTNWLTGDWAHSIYYHFLPPNSAWRDCGVPRLSSSNLPGARSGHAGGVHVAFGDGHAEFIAETIDLRLWREIGSRDGWEGRIE